MQSAIGREDPTLASRFECKYVVSRQVTPQIRQFLTSFTEPDPFAVRCPGNRYPISSLYLDSPDMVLYQQTVSGEKNRFKLRVRTYSDDPDSPAFLEVKRKINNIVSKHRAAVDRPTALAMLAPEFRAPGGSYGSEEIDYFETYCRLTEARPVCKVRYMREAYQSRGGDPVRVTIDNELTHAACMEADLSHADGRWVETSIEGDIVEIKYTDLCPYWVNDLVRTFNLKQRPVPKYVMSVDGMRSGDPHRTTSIAGIALPPRRVFG